MTQPDERHWHMSKVVSWANIVSTLILLLAVVTSAAAFTSRVAVLESETGSNSLAIRDIRADQAIQYRELVRLIERVESKLDRKLDGG